MNDNTPISPPPRVPTPTGTLTSFERADQLSDEFERLLSEVGVRIATGGVLERLLLVVKRFADWQRDENRTLDGLDLRTSFRELVGAMQIVQLAVGGGSLAPFKEHLALLNDGSPLQNVPAPPNDPSSDKVLELLIGLAAARMGASVSMDHPNRSKGDNPDVVAEFREAKWGFACKSMSGDAPATLYERIAEGVGQIERSPADRGFVVISFKNRVDHDAALPSFGVDADGHALLGVHSSHQKVVDDLREFARKRVRAMCEYATLPEIESLFAGKKASPIVLIVLQTTCGQLLPGGVAPNGLTGAPFVTRIGFLHAIQLVPVARDLDAALDVFDALNQAFHV